MGTTCASLRTDAAKAVNRAYAKFWLLRGRWQAADPADARGGRRGLAGVLIVVVSRLAVTACRRGSAPVAPGRERR